MSKSTPGPWLIDDKHKAGDFIGIFVPTLPRMVATVMARNDGSGLHNAKLIAAAPDLLAACKAAVNCIEEFPEFKKTLRVLRDAIAKAEAQ